MKKIIYKIEGIFIDMKNTFGINFDQERDMILKMLEKHMDLTEDKYGECSDLEDKKFELEDELDDVERDIRWAEDRLEEIEEDIEQAKKLRDEIEAEIEELRKSVSLEFTVK